jgi:hypothetical protein
MFGALGERQFGGRRDAEPSPPEVELAATESVETLHGR